METTRLRFTRFECNRYLRNTRFWIVSALLFVVSVGTATGTILAPLGPATESVLGPNTVLGAFQSKIFYIGGLAACFVGYSSISGDKASGQLRTFLKLPYSRRSLFVQKVVGRSIAVVTVTATAVIAGIVVTIPVFGIPSLTAIIAFLLISAFYQTTLVTIATAVSALLPSSRQAMATVVGLFLFGWLFGQAFAARVAAYISEEPINLLATEPSPGLTLYLTIERLLPMDAYFVLTNWVLGVGNAATDVQSVVQELHPNINKVTVVVSEVYDTTPLLLSEWFSAVLLIVWIGLALLVGISQFNRSDIK
nr:ABC transporter permease subunit [Halogeometricum borinquense]